MLNHRGGRVLFGVKLDGRIIGQMVRDHTGEGVPQKAVWIYAAEAGGLGETPIACRTKAQDRRS